MDKVEPIILKYEDGREYTLEFNRNSVVFAEKNGFDINNVGSQLMTRIPELFWYAFRMHHPSVTQKQAEHILFEDMGGITEDITERLISLYNQPYMSLLSGDGEPKNAQMKVIL